MHIRRVVTGHDRNGKAVVVVDGPPPRGHDYVHHPGFVETLVWATDAVPAAPPDRTDPTASVTSFVPPPGGTRFIVLTLPPDSIVISDAFDGAAAGAEHLQHSPGIAERMEPDSPGMHTTPTMDYVVVLAGEVWLELDDGEAVQLRPTDVVIQNGTRHAWRNRTDKPATIAAILVGAAGS
jgi:hypothetical protein